MNKLVITAHPDDETIFAGKLLSEDNSCKVVCVTNGEDEIRKSEFESVMKQVKVEHEIWNFHDEWKVDLDQDGIRKKLHTLLREKEWDMVLTHNEVGDNGYRHPHHKQVFECVKAKISNIDKLYCFDNHGRDLTLDQVKKKLSLLNFYKSRVFLIKIL